MQLVQCWLNKIDTDKHLGLIDLTDKSVITGSEKILYY